MSRTTDKYIKIKKASDTAPENEIRIKAVPRIGKYIAYAASLLLEKKLDTVLIKASGNAAKSACQVAEILRHRIVGLHQLTDLKTISVVDEYEPREEGLDKVTVERKLAVLEINLSLKDGIFDTKAPGYQAPLPKDQVQAEDLQEILKRRTTPGGDRERDERRGGDRERGERGEGRGRGGFRRGRFAGGRGGFGRGGRRGDFEGRRGEFEGRREGGDRRGYEGKREGGDRRGYEGKREGGDRRGYEGKREGGDRREFDGSRRGGYGGRGNSRGGSKI